MHWLIIAVSTIAFAQKPKVKVSDIPTDEDTSITIRKGVQNTQCVQYDIVDGRDEIFGSPEYDRSKAYKSWQTACSEWKQSMREANRENSIITLNCQAPAVTKEGDQHTYKSNGTYKMKVKMAEKAQ